MNQQIVQMLDYQLRQLFFDRPQPTALANILNFTHTSSKQPGDESKMLPVTSYFESEQKFLTIQHFNLYTNQDITISELIDDNHSMQMVKTFTSQLNQLMQKQQSVCNALKCGNKSSDRFSNQLYLNNADGVVFYYCYNKFQKINQNELFVNCYNTYITNGDKLTGITLLLMAKDDQIFNIILNKLKSDDKKTIIHMFALLNDERIVKVCQYCYEEKIADGDLLFLNFKCLTREQQIQCANYLE